ncbi:MAG TPA: radical SAM protein [Planctomycetota bacterium]|nr:radical SAM protein [Planctomycetota bacterium]
MKYSFNTIYFESTRRCNLSCDLCMASSNVAKTVRESVKQELSADEIETRVLMAGREIGCRVVSWSGGEFMLRKDAAELVRRATKHGYESSICTNGTVATAARLKELHAASGGTLVVAVGINSIDNENAWTRDCDCDVALKTIALCEELGIKRHAVVNVGRHNLATIGKTLQYLEEHGIPYNRSPFTARGSGAQHFDSLCVSPDEMRDTLHPQLRKHANGYVSYTPFFVAPEVHERFSKGQRNVTVPQGPSIGCWIGTWIAVNAEGDVAPCGILLDICNWGNVREKSLQQIIDESSQYQALLDRNNLQGKCGRCRYKFVCGGCRALALFKNGSLLAEDPTCFFEPVDESTVCEHEAETNYYFKRYAFMARHAGSRLLHKTEAGQSSLKEQA